MGGAGGVVAEKWRQLYLNNNKKITLKNKKYKFMHTTTKEKKTI